MKTRGRVLIIGPSKVGDMAWFVALAYRRLGWEAESFDDRAFIGRDLPGSAGKALRRIELGVLEGRRRRLGQLIRESIGGFDHVLTVKGEYFLPEDVEAISAQLPFVNWHPDHPFLDEDLSCLPHYTWFCPKDDWTTERLSCMGFTNVRTVVHASDPKILYAPRVDPPEDVMTVAGGIYPYRQHWIDQARKAGVAVRVWGGVAHGEPPGVVSHRRRALGADLGVAMRSGTFTLNSHHPHDIAGANQRLFDAAAAGVPQLTEELPDSVRHFDRDSEICTFRDTAEFQANVRELISNPALCERLAKGSYERLCDEHLYEHRIQEILSVI
jgi:hypothetical protein